MRKEGKDGSVSSLWAIPVSKQMNMHMHAHVEERETVEVLVKVKRFVILQEQNDLRCRKMEERGGKECELKCPLLHI